MPIHFLARCIVPLLVTALLALSPVYGAEFTPPLPEPWVSSSALDDSRPKATAIDETSAGNADVLFDHIVNLPIVFGIPPREKYPADNRAYELEVLRLVNVERAKVGLPVLIEDAALTQAARRHASDMAANTIRGHIGSDGTMPSDRMVQEGYDGLPWSEASSFNRPSPDAAVEAWMASPGHRAILLDLSVNEIGIGCAHNPTGLYQQTWVVDTGKGP